MMASATVFPQGNLRSYILSALQRIYRDLETVSSSIDRNITEHVLYRLEHVIVLILQCQSTWPNFIDEETVQIIFKVYQEVEKSVCKTWEIVTEAKSSKPGRPEVSIPEDTLKLYLNYGFPKRVVARPNQPNVSPRPKVQVTSVAPTNSNRHPISSSQHNSLNRPDQKCCQSNRPDQALKSAVNQTAPTKSAHPLSQIAKTKARLIPQRTFCLPQLRLLMS